VSKLNLSMPCRITPLMAGWRFKGTAASNENSPAGFRDVYFAAGAGGAGTGAGSTGTVTPCGCAFGLIQQA